MPPSRKVAFQLNEADSHREDFERFGRRVAMHLERRDVDQAHAVVAEAARFLFEIDNPQKADDPLEIPITAVYSDPFVLEFLARIGAFTIGNLLAKSPHVIQTTSNVGPRRFAVIVGGLRRTIGGRLALEWPEWARAS